jgi:hypothetical protein
VPRRARADRRVTPVAALEAKHSEFARRLARRRDRFSQLLSRAFADEHSGQYLVTRSGLTPAEQAELSALEPAAETAFRLELRAAIANLRELLGLGDPLCILALVQFHNVIAAWGEYFEPTNPGMENKVELVAGLLATQPAGPRSVWPSDQQLESILEEIDHVVDVGVLVNLAAPRGEDPTAATLRFSAITHWMTVRGTSFAHHGRELALALYQPEDRTLRDRYGFTVDDVLAVGDAIEELMTSRFNSLMREAGVFGELVAKEAKQLAEDGTVGEETRRAIRSRGGRLKLRNAAMGEAIKTGLREALMVTPDAIASARPELASDRIQSVLLELSISVGSLPAATYTGLFDASPLVERPLIEFEGSYALCVPGMMNRDAVTLLESRLKDKPAFIRRRAKTLDRLAVEYLASMLPGSKPYANLFYEGTELDGLVLFERSAFVVEGKGSTISVPARRGAIDRLRRDIARAVEQAWEQGARAREYLLEPGEKIFTDERGREQLRIPAGVVREVVIVNPTLHELAGHATQLPRLRSLGLFPAGEFPWSVFINDLRTISETCENAAVFLHYLEWRGRLPLGDRLEVGDELDLWASYLLSERFGALEGSGMLMVANASTDFDAYYNGILGHGPVVPKPRKFLEQPVLGFVDRMAARRPAGWREAAGACLELSAPELGLVCLKAEDVARRAAESGEVVGLDLDRVMVVGVPPGRNPAISLFGFEPSQADPTILIAVQLDGRGHVEVSWASYRKPVSFKLSPLERALFESPRTSPFQSPKHRRPAASPD